MYSIYTATGQPLLLQKALPWFMADAWTKMYYSIEHARIEDDLNVKTVPANVRTHDFTSNVSSEPTTFESVSLAYTQLEHRPNGLLCRKVKMKDTVQQRRRSADRAF